MIDQHEELEKFLDQRIGQNYNAGVIAGDLIADGWRKPRHVAACDHPTEMPPLGPKPYFIELEQRLAKMERAFENRGELFVPEVWPAIGSQSRQEMLDLATKIDRVEAAMAQHIENLHSRVRSTEDRTAERIDDERERVDELIKSYRDELAELKGQLNTVGEVMPMGEQINVELVTGPHDVTKRYLIESLKYALPSDHPNQEWQSYKSVDTVEEAEEILTEHRGRGVRLQVHDTAHPNHADPEGRHPFSWRIDEWNGVKWTAINSFPTTSDAAVWYADSLRAGMKVRLVDATVWMP